MNKMKKKQLLTSSKGLMFASAMMLMGATPQEMMAAKTAQVVQQSDVVKGQILDANGEPIIGATIKVQGTSNGTISDIDGNFSLDAKENAMLEISYIGYKTQTVKATGKSLQIKMEEDDQA